MSEYILDGYTLHYLPAPGRYSGFAPQRARAEMRTLSGAVPMDWGVVEEEAVLVLEAPWVGAEEFSALDDKYRDEEAEGTPKHYTFQDPERAYEVEIAGLEGRPYQHLRAGVRLSLRVLSAGA